MPAVYSIGITLGTEINLSNSNGDSTVPQIAANSTDVYVVWVDVDTTNTDTEVLFSNSSDSGSTFGNPINITSSLTGGTQGDSKDPQIAFSGDNIYVLWEEEPDDDADSDILLAISNDNGRNFGVPLNMSKTFTANSAEVPQISVNGSNVYVVWRDFHNDASGDVYFRSSTDSGVTWSPILDNDPTNLSGTAGEPSDNPMIGSSGNSVYVVWEDESGATDKIYFRGSADNGANFTPAIGNTPSDLDSASTNTKRSPELSVSGDDIHITWREFTAKEVNYRTVTNDGGGAFTFSPVLGSDPTNIRTSANTPNEPHIASSGSNVYIVWRETTVFPNIDIFFSNSTNTGTSFSDTENLTGDNNPSIQPQIAVSGNNVFVVWRDETGGTDTDILVQGSFSSGFADFGSNAPVTDNADIATTPQVAASGSTVYVVWNDNGDDPDAGTNTEIMFRSGTPSGVDVEFDAANYKLTDTATITVNAPASNTDADDAETINISVTSDIDPVGLTSVTLTETGPNTNDFSGTITFTESASSSGTTLRADPGDTITATSGAQTGTATIFTRTVTIDKASYILSDLACIEVTDQNSNIDIATAETIEVTVTAAGASSSPNNPATITLTETGVDTGVFGGNPGGGCTVSLLFMNGYDAFPFDRKITITQEDLAANADAGAIDQTTVTISTEEVANVVITLTETGINTGIFTGKIQFITGTTSGNNIKAGSGDLVTIAHGGKTSRVLITPNPDPSNAGLRVSVAVTDPNGDPDTFTASYKGVTSAASTVELDGDESGGGGGGLVRPSLVLDILAAALPGGGGGAPTITLDQVIASKVINVPDHIKEIVELHDPLVPIEPREDDGSFDFPLSIDGKGYVIASFSNTLETHTIQAGEPTTLKNVFYDNDKIKHISMYLNLRGGEDSIRHSDTQIIWNAGEPLKIIDPNGFFESVNVIFTEDEDGLKKEVIFEIVFAKGMETTDMILRQWDENLSSRDTIIRDAIMVLPPLPEEEDRAEEDAEIISEPGEGDVEVSELKIEYSNDVPDWIKTNAKWWNEGHITDTDFKSGVEFLIKNNVLKLPQSISDKHEQLVQNMPHWIKFNAGWWSDGLLTDQEFVNGIKWLYENGIITVRYVA